eukprot:m.379276 g.379276  ORF g.379276 m.379276 type:complete len:199 (+) comp20950_c0_seq2:492-1088(+)
MANSTEPTRIDLSQSRYDLSSYWGRVKHFMETTDMRLVLASDAELYESKKLLLLYEKGLEPDGTTTEDLYRAKRLYDSAFHPQSGELMWQFGRMSFCVPGNVILGVGMLVFYQSTAAVVFWQVMNQSFNSALNYVNRNTSNAVSNNWWRRTPRQPEAPPQWPLASTSSSAADPHWQRQWLDGWYHLSRSLRRTASTCR